MRPRTRISPLPTVLAAVPIAASGVAIAATRYQGKPPLGKVGSYLTAIAPTVGHIGSGAFILGLLLQGLGGHRAVTATAKGLGLAAIKAGKVGTQPKREEGRNETAGKLSIYFHNVLYENPDQCAKIARQIDKLNPDLVVLVEAEEKATVGLNEILPNYPYLHTWKTDTPDGYLIASKLPLNNLHIPPTHSTRPPLVFEVAPQGCAPLLIAAVHLNAPDTGPKLQKWVREHHLLAGILNRYPRKKALLVLGDFNAGRHHAPFRRLLKEARLYDLARSAPTWPVGRGKIPTLFPLDHALIRGPFPQTEARILPAAGSDHHGLIVNLGLPEQADI